MGQEKTRIVLADNVVAYLPVWLANDLNPWIALDDGERLTFDGSFSEIVPPPLHLLTSFSDPDDKIGDRGCLNSVLAAFEKGNPCIGICDPCEIPVMRKESELVVVGGLIKDACFWCLADPSIASGSDPQHLNATHITMHERGFSTGYFIGQDVADTISEFHNNRVMVTAYGSVGTVVDGAIGWIKSGQHGVATITASVLSAALAIESGELKEAFPLHKLPKFQNFLTTAIVVHRDSLKDRHFRDRVHLLLFGIIFARRHMINTKDETIKYIKNLCRQEKFGDERRIHQAQVIKGMIVSQPDENASIPITTSAAKTIYEKLVGTEDIYCVDCEITPEQWKKGHFGIRLQNCLQWPELSDLMDNGMLMEAQKTYNDRMLTDDLKRDHQAFKANVMRSVYWTRLAIGAAFFLMFQTIDDWYQGNWILPIKIALILAIISLIIAPEWRIWISHQTRRVAELLSSKAWSATLIFISSGICLIALLIIVGVGGANGLPAPQAPVITLVDVYNRPGDFSGWFVQWSGKYSQLVSAILGFFFQTLWTSMVAAYRRSPIYSVISRLGRTGRERPL